MHRRLFIGGAGTAGLFGAVSPVRAQADWPEGAECFAAEQARGTLVVVDARHGREVRWVHDGARAARRVSPASTFKIPHSLFALDAGVLRDEFQVIPWDGVKRANEAWNADQTLRSAFRESAVWVYERFARQIGEAREAAYLRRLGYGNQRTSGARPFWVEGDLAISADEQIDFLRRLHRHRLPFRVEHQRLVMDVMINEAGRDWTLRAKTGWSGTIGWWVGWVEGPEGPVFFALNIDTPHRLEDLPKRQAIVRAALRRLKALPDA